MAKQRYINTKFWSDGFVSELNPLDRYLFLYFLTNEHTNIAGIYELPLKTISFETGLELDMLKKMIGRLKEKVWYIDGWVCIKNFQKHQNTASIKIQKGIEAEVMKIPLPILDKIGELNKSEGKTDRVSIGYGKPIIYSNTNTNIIKSNTSAKAEEKSSKFNKMGAEVLKAFEAVDPKNKTYYGNKTQRAACDYLLEQFGLDAILKRIEVLPRTNKIPYFPVINTPYELKEKWVKLEDAVRKSQTEKTLKNKTNVIW